MDDFITKCVEQNIKVDADYRNYVIEEFKKAAKGEKVNYDFGAWVCTPQAFDTNKSDIVETNDIINKENERFSEILNRINNERHYILMTLLLLMRLFICRLMMTVPIKLRNLAVM